MNTLVVGGGRGIGRAIAVGLAEPSCAVGVVARTVHELDETVHALRDLGATAWRFPADVLDRGSIRAAVNCFVESAGGLDTVVYAAGRFKAVGPLVSVGADDWWIDLETTLKGFTHVVRETVPALRVSPAPSLITLIGPGHARELAFGSGYATAQAGLARLVESLDVELRADKIPIYAVNPGLVPTALIGHILDSPAGRRWLPQFTEAFAEGKEVGPEVVVEMVIWLATTRPPQLSGRVVASLLAPSLLEARLGRIVEDDLGKLRLR